MNNLLEQAVALPVPERIKLLEEIWDSIAIKDEAIDLDEDQVAELERRIEYHRLHPEDTVAWETVRDEALARR